MSRCPYDDNDGLNIVFQCFMSTRLLSVINDFTKPDKKLLKGFKSHIHEGQLASKSFQHGKLWSIQIAQEERDIAILSESQVDR